MQAQKGHWMLSLTPGIMYYQGDMTENGLPNCQTTHFSAALDIGYRRGNIFTFTFGYQFGKISGADSLYSSKKSRNLHFYSYVHDIRLLTYIDLIGIWRKIKPPKTLGRQDWGPGFTGPNLIIGIGFMHFQPRGDLDGKSYKLQKLGTEGQYLSGGSSPYSLWTFNYKYGLGFGYNITRQINIELQAVYIVTFTDYLDDVSTTYPNYNELIKSPNGPTTAYFTYGGRDGSVVREGLERGNSAKNDGIMTFGVKVTYTFGRSEFTRLMNL